MWDEEPVNWWYPCHRCFSFRDRESGLWLRSTRPTSFSTSAGAFANEYRQLSLTDGERAHFWSWMPGREAGYDMPGDTGLDFYLQDATAPSGSSYRGSTRLADNCLGHNGSQVGWTRCPWQVGECQEHGGATDCYDWLFSAWATETGSGTLLGRRNDGGGGLGIENETQLVSMHDGPPQRVFDVVCNACPTHELDSKAYTLIIGSVLISVIPVLAMLARRLTTAMRRRRTHTSISWWTRAQACTTAMERVPCLESSRPMSQLWPRRPQAYFALALFQAGWCLCVMGMLPWLLWWSGGYWSGDSMTYFSLSIVGVALMMLTMRPDTSVWTIRGVAALTIGCLLMMTLTSIPWALEQLDSALWLIEQDGENKRQLAMLVRLPTGILFFAEAAWACVYSLSMLPVFWRNRILARKRLWACSRVAFLVNALMMLALSLFGTLALALSFREDRLERHGVKLHVAEARASVFIFGLSFLLTVVITSPKLRLGVHIRLNTALNQRCSNPARARAALQINAIELHSGSGTSTKSPYSHHFDAWDGIDLRNWEDEDKRFEGLQLRESLGRGGYSVVFRGCLEGYGDVAVKALLRRAYSERPVDVELLRREQMMAKTLAHPRIVNILGTTLMHQAHGPQPALVMELLTGGNLADRIRSSTPATPSISLALRARVALEVAEGIAYLHDNAVVHRDVKPSNVLLTADDHAKLSDFGIATRLGAEAPTAARGTLRYMAPEVAFAAYDCKADVFSFAMLLFELLHLERAFPDVEEGITVFLMYHLHDKRPPLHLSVELEEFSAVLKSCWAGDPAMRMTMPEVIHAFTGMLKSQVLRMHTDSSGCSVITSV